MPWFLAVAIVIYSLIQYTLFLRLRCLLPAGAAWRWLLAAWLGLMVLAIPLGHLCANLGLGAATKPLLFMGYYWMGGSFLALVLSIGSWIGQFIITVAYRWRGRRLPDAWRRALAALVVVLAVACSIYAVHEAGDIQVTRLTIPSPKLPAEVKRVRVVLLSDLHLSMVLDGPWLEKVATMVGDLKPDVLVVTGDLMDRGMEDPEAMIARLKSMPARLGKFAVTGNHERFYGPGEALDFMKRAGLTVLQGAAALPAPYLRIVGFDDPAFAPPIDEAEVLAKLKPGPFTIVLKHRPQVADHAAGRFDLQLSGHAHSGQIWPFTYVTGLLFPLQGGLHGLDRGSLIYTSRGTGTWGPPMRFLAPPEIAVIDLTTDKLGDREE